MPIQFRCSSCNKPVEIDDEWAGQSVACPFCGGENLAPHETDLVWDQQDLAGSELHRPPSGAPPDALPGSPPQPADTPRPDVFGQYPPVPAGLVVARNPYGKWSVALGIIAWILLAGSLVGLTALMLSVINMDELMPDKNNPDMSAQWRKGMEMGPEVQQRLADKGLGWIWGILTFVQILSAAAALVGGILAIAGLTRRRTKKGSSIAGLILSGPIVLCSCCVFSIAIVGGVAGQAG